MGVIYLNQFNFLFHYQELVKKSDLLFVVLTNEIACYEIYVFLVNKMLNMEMGSLIVYFIYIIMAIFL